MVLNEGLQVIDFGTFEYCTTLTSIAFPSTVTEVRKGAFEYCVNLRDVVLNEGLQKIGTFKYCESLESITLPSTVTELEQFAFCMCINLKEVVLNEGLLKIPPHTFNSCSSLERIAIPSTVVEIGSGAFQGCDNLREVLLHENIEKMEKFGFNVNAFGGCRSLERFDFPSLSARLDSIIRAGQIDIIVKIDGISSVERDDSELFVTATAMGGGRNMGSEWNTVKESLDEIVKLITYYEVKEATTLFELALWKAKIDQAADADEISRDACRTEVPGPVKDTILLYAYTLDTAENKDVGGVSNVEDAVEINLDECRTH